MSASSSACPSCGMPIESGVYCQYCVDEAGNLQEFDERFRRMVQWMLRQKQAATRADAETRALAYMATMPAWRDHEKLRAAQKQHKAGR
jgi:hypothetical protein